MSRGNTFCIQHERNPRTYLLPRVSKVHAFCGIWGLFHVFIFDDLFDRYAHQGHGWDLARDYGEDEDFEQVPEGGGFLTVEQAGSREDTTSILQFPLAGTSAGPIIRPLRNNEAVGRNAVLRWLQTLLLPLLLLHLDPKIPKIDHPASRFHLHPASHPKITRRECQQNNRHRQ